MKDSMDLQVVGEQNGLEATKLETLLSKFSKSYADAKELASDAHAIIVTEESQTELMLSARAKRLALKNIRVEVEKTRIALKEQSLREGKAIDGMSNIIKALIVPVEEYLENQEKFADIKAAERKAARYSGRVAELSEYVQDVNLYNLNDMEDDAFAQLVKDSKAALLAEQKARAAADEARIQREKEEQEERERVRLENIQLKEQAAKQEVVFAAERKALEEKLKAEQAARAEADRKVSEEREAKRKEAEAAEEALKKSLLSPDKDKLSTLAETMSALQFPDVSSDEAVGIIESFKTSLSAAIDDMRAKIGKL